MARRSEKSGFGSDVPHTIEQLKVCAEAKRILGVQPEAVDLPAGRWGWDFRRITFWSTEYGQFQVDWKDLCLDGRGATEQERKEMLSKMPPGMTVGEARVGGFSYRIRARFVSDGVEPSVK